MWWQSLHRICCWLQVCDCDLFIRLSFTSAQGAKIKKNYGQWKGAFITLSSGYLKPLQLECYILWFKCAEKSCYGYWPRTFFHLFITRWTALSVGEGLFLCKNVDWSNLLMQGVAGKLQWKSCKKSSVCSRKNHHSMISHMVECIPSLFLFNIVL